MSTEAPIGASDEELPHEAFLAALASLDGAGPRRLMWLLGQGAPAEVFRRVGEGRLGPSPSSLGVGGDLRSSWRRQAQRLDPVEIWHRCVAAGIGVLSPGAPGYPPRLAADSEPPIVLFHHGDPDVLVAPTVAVVGTRRATGYGRRIAFDLGAKLSAAGIVVVSGLAMGIDGAAHRGVLDVEGAPPVGVVGAGLDQPCPARNLSVANVVAARGALLSEVPPQTPSAPWRFPVRNRVIAALCDALVVVESTPSGGSMHTVREAMERDRPVLAVPGPIDADASSGTNLLIRDGAHPLLDVEDVFDVLGISAGRSEVEERLAADPRPRPGPAAAAVLDELGWRPLSVSYFADVAGLDPRQLSMALFELEEAGWVRRNNGWIERIARPELRR